MKVPYKWLKEYIDFNLLPGELSEKLTMLGFEAENAGELLDLEITANRGDCLSIIGIAREISALTGNSLKKPIFNTQLDFFSLPKEKDSTFPEVQIKEEKLCPRYTACLVKNVKVAESPPWLKEKLTLVGIRTINNIVDITNYVLVEYGQPLHAFDYEKVSKNSIIIRRAEEGETIVALDETEQKLDSQMLVIADKEKSIALAGIMGGLNTEVKEDTKMVLLESACFNPANIRKTSKRLNLQSESSYRFERGIDPEGIIPALKRASQLIQELAKGEIVGAIDKYPFPFPVREVSLRVKRVNEILGTKLNVSRILAILKKLHFKIIDSHLSPEIIHIKVPTYRRDITREIDLIEEIARLYGYDRIKSTLPKAPLASGGVKSLLSNRKDVVREITRNFLFASGFSEVINYSFLNESVFAHLRLSSSHPWRKVVKIRNPLNENQNILRTTLIPGLLSTLLWNAKRDILNLKIFELGKVFLPSKEKADLPEENYVLAGAVMNFKEEKIWGKKERLIDFFDLKGIIENFFNRLGIVNFEIIPRDYPFFHPHYSSCIMAKDGLLAMMGKLHPEIAESYKLSEETYIFEIDFENLLKQVNLTKKYSSLPKYPGIYRDIALIVKQGVSSQKIVNIIKNTGKNLIEEVNLFDLYQGEQIPEGHKSLAYSLLYRHHKRTLTDQEIDTLHQQIIQKLTDKLGAEVREK